jgi:hypothetical protein
MSVTYSIMTFDQRDPDADPHQAWLARDGRWTWSGRQAETLNEARRIVRQLEDTHPGVHYKLRPYAPE